MTNKEVETKVREIYALRNADDVKVKFECMCNDKEDYTVIDFVEQGNKVYKRSSRVLVFNEKVISCEVTNEETYYLW